MSRPIILKPGEHRVRLNCRISPETVKAIELVQKLKGLNQGRAIDFIVSAYADFVELDDYRKRLRSKGPKQ